MSATVADGVLMLACSSLPAPPLFWTDEDGTRHGYEPDAAAAVAEAAGLELRWIFRQWSGMRPALEAGECDAIWCGSAITDERRLVFDYTEPYAIFDESVLDRKFLVNSSDSLRATRALAEKEAIFAGISSGAVVHVAQRIARDIEAGDVVCLLADAGWKYLSTQAWVPEIERAEKGVEETLWW